MLIPLFITFTVLTNLLWNPQALHALSNEQEDQEDLLDKGDIAELFEFGSGIFAAILLALSLIAYRDVKCERGYSLCQLAFRINCNSNTLTKA